MGESLWLWVMMLVVVNGNWSCFGCWEEERIALLQLKADINFPNGASLASWVDEKTANCCNWDGVECNTTTSHVIQLSLDSTRDWMRLGDWYFNASLFLPFKQLRTLHLPGNSLVGWVENEGFEKLSRLSTLKVLDLATNFFRCSILSPLSRLSSLRSLYLGGNNMESPTGMNRCGRLSRLRNLEVLDLSANSFIGGIESFLELNDLISLKELDVSSNEIESIRLIKDLERQSVLSKLEVLYLNANFFNNNIVSSLNRLPSLKILNLRENQLNGSFHFRELNALSNLEELDISHNEINSLVTSQGIGTSSKLKVLHLDRLNLTESNPLHALGAFPSLKTLYFKYNNLTRRKINPQELRNLSNLEDLILDGTSLDGNILQSIGALTSLEVLSVSGCKLNGSLPKQGWCDLTNLQELDLSHNQLEGILPSCLENLASLRSIDLSENQFTGNIASSPLITLTSLEYFSLSNNHFQVPISFRSFSNHSNLKVIWSDNNTVIPETGFQTWVPRFQLKFLSMSHCKFNVTVLPSFLYYQYDLRFVDLSHNNFGGTFPSWLFENNTRMESLYLQENSFTGDFRLPSHRNPFIFAIDVSNNNLQGQIPTNMSSIFPWVEYLNMSVNALEGYIPSCFGDMKALVILDLSNNNLSREIPKQLAMGCSSLTFLKLSNNQLHGAIFPSSFNLPYLNFLYLDGNNFTGMLPNSLSAIKNLLSLDVSNNHLSGKLPRWLGNMTSLEGIAMSRNNLEGPIPTEFCKLDILRFLDLSENNLSGSIPSCFNPSDIRHVHLNKNRLEGPMTRAFSNCPFLVTLDLGDNNLTGNIPPWIGSLNSLSILILKANHFEGNIPIRLCFLRGLSMMDLSRNNLCGSIPHCLNKVFTHEVTNYDKTFVPLFGLGYDVTNGRRSSQLLYVGKTKLAQKEYDSPYIDHSFYGGKEQVEFTTKTISYPYQGDILNLMSGIDLSCNQLSGAIPLGIGNLINIRALNLSHNNLNGSIPTTFSNLRQIESLDLSYNKLNGRIPPQLIELNFLAVFSVAHNNLSGMTPERKGQFATFNENSYRENPLLCGPPLRNNCSASGSQSPTPNGSGNDAEDDGFIDTEAFYGSFVASYITILLGIAVMLYINPYWRQVWFCLVERSITSSYYFVVDNFPKLCLFGCK